MIKYITEEIADSTRLFMVDEENNIKVLVAVIFEKANAAIIKRKMNEYVSNRDGQEN